MIMPFLQWHDIISDPKNQRRYIMPKAKKTSSGRWKVTIYDYKDSTGKVHRKSFTADTKREAERMAAEYQQGPALADLTVGEAVKRYIDLKKAVLSPSTHRSYSSIYRTHFAESRFGAQRLSALTSESTQRFISDLDVSPKSVRNITGLLTSSTKMFRPEAVFHITLPALKKPDLYTPNTDEVKRLIESIKSDRQLYIFVMLCAFGPMRRSEACAVKYEDIDRKQGVITVRRSRVNSEDGWIYKDLPKNYSSYRTIPYPESVIKAIGAGFGYVLEDTPAALSDRFSRRVKSAGLPHFRVHDLRHYGASVLHAIGIPDQYIMARGGWKTDNVMKRVYRDTLTDVEKEMNTKVANYFEAICT